MAVTHVQSLKLNAMLDRFLNLIPDEHRDGFRPSGMGEFCAIQHFWTHVVRFKLPKTEEGRARRRELLTLMAKEKQRRFSGQTKRRLHTGHHKHDQYRLYLGQLGFLRGDWQCSYCATLVRTEPDLKLPTVKVYQVGSTEADIRVPAPCPTCDGRNLFERPVAWYYIEQKVSKGGINGSVDGGVILPKIPGKGVLEIKSSNAYYYSGKAEPLPFQKHRHQANLYAWAGTRDYVWYVYINKDDDAVKDFIVPLQQKFVTATLADVEHTTEAIEALKPPSSDFRVCASPTASRAVSCSAAEPCFSSVIAKAYLATL